MDKQNFITRINNTDIVTVDKDGETYVPIKPICEAIGVDAKSQRAKLQEDEFFASVGAIITSTGSDGKEAKDRRKKAEKDLDKLRAARLNPQPTLF